MRLVVRGTFTAGETHPQGLDQGWQRVGRDPRPRKGETGTGDGPSVKPKGGGNLYEGDLGRTGTGTRVGPPRPDPRFHLGPTRGLLPGVSTRPSATARASRESEQGRSAGLSGVVLSQCGPTPEDLEGRTPLLPSGTSSKTSWCLKLSTVPEATFTVPFGREAQIVKSNSHWPSRPHRDLDPYLRVRVTVRKENEKEILIHRTDRSLVKSAK